MKDEEEGEGNDILNEKKINEINGKIKNKKKDKNLKQKIQQQRRNKLNIMTKYFRVNVLFFLIKIIVILFSSLTYYLLSTYIKTIKKNNLVDFYETNESVDNVYKDSFDIYISLLRKLDIYESNLINCQTIGNFVPMDIPKIGDLKTPKFGNIVMQITTSTDFESESLDKFNTLYENNACSILIVDSYNMPYCNQFWSGVLLKGLEQAIIQMDVIIGTVLDELQSLNDANNRTLLSLMSGSSFIEYSQFIQFYIFRAYNETYLLFNDLREQKLKKIINLLKLIIFFYIVISLFLFCLLIYFVYSFNSLFNSFLNFIGIFPSKYLSEDEIFYSEIIHFGEKYF